MENNNNLNCSNNGCGASTSAIESATSDFYSLNNQSDHNNNNNIHNLISQTPASTSSSSNYGNYRDCDLESLSSRRTGTTFSKNRDDDNQEEEAENEGGDENDEEDRQEEWYEEYSNHHLNNQNNNTNNNGNNNPEDDEEDEDDDDEDDDENSHHYSSQHQINLLNNKSSSELLNSSLHPRQVRRSGPAGAARLTTSSLNTSNNNNSKFLSLNSTTVSAASSSNPFELNRHVNNFDFDYYSVNNNVLDFQPKSTQFDKILNDSLKLKINKNSSNNSTNNINKKFSHQNLKKFLNLFTNFECYFTTLFFSQNEHYKLKNNENDKSSSLSSSSVVYPTIKRLKKHNSSGLNLHEKKEERHNSAHVENTIEINNQKNEQKSLIEKYYKESLQEAIDHKKESSEQAEFHLCQLCSHALCEPITLVCGCTYCKSCLNEYNRMQKVINERKMRLIRLKSRKNKLSRVVQSDSPLSSSSLSSSLSCDSSLSDDGEIDECGGGGSMLLNKSKRKRDSPETSLANLNTMTSIGSHQMDQNLNDDENAARDSDSNRSMHNLIGQDEEEEQTEARVVSIDEKDELECYKCSKSHVQNTPDILKQNVLVSKLVEKFWTPNLDNRRLRNDIRKYIANLLRNNSSLEQFEYMLEQAYKLDMSDHLLLVDLFMVNYFLNNDECMETKCALYADQVCELRPNWAFGYFMKSLVHEKQCDFVKQKELLVKCIRLVNGKNNTEQLKLKLHHVSLTFLKILKIYLL